MKLHEKVFYAYLIAALLCVLLAISIGVTVVLRLHGVPKLSEFIAKQIPFALLSTWQDPVYLMVWIVVALFLWAATFMFFGGFSWNEDEDESGPDNHRRGRRLESKTPDEFAELLHRREMARKNRRRPAEGNGIGRANQRRKLRRNEAEWDEFL